MTIPFEVQRNANPMPKAQREALLVNPVFGQNRTDHQVVCSWEKEKGQLQVVGSLQAQSVKTSSSSGAIPPLRLKNFSAAFTSPCLARSAK